MIASLSYNRIPNEPWLGAKILHRLGIAMRRFLLAVNTILFLFWHGAALAQDKPTGGSSVMEARDLAVDATADSAVQARAVALAEGQRRALNQILRRLTLREDWSRLPLVAAEDLPNLVESLAIADEKTSNVRYLAKISVRFKKAGIDQLLTEGDIPYSDTQAKPALILPVWEAGGVRLLFEDENPWRLAWESLPLTDDDLLPLRLPLSDLADISSLGSEAALLGHWSRFEGLNGRYGTQSVIAVHAVALPDGGVQINMLWHTVEGTTSTITSYQSEAGNDLGVFLQWLAGEISGELADNWKRRTLINFGEENSLSVRIPFDGLKAWNAIRNKLKKISLVQKFKIVSITRSDAQLELYFLGDPQRLSLSLAQQDLQLFEVDGYWEIKQRTPAGN